jgi:RNA polymerase sigma factor (sigma-70 family)
MTEFSQDEAIRGLMRRMFADEVADSGFDVETGLRDVMDRVAVSTLVTVPRTEKVPVAVGMTGAPPVKARPLWMDLTGRDRHTACIRAARDGDKEAFDALIADLTPLVWHVARGSGLDRATAEDVVQTVWLGLLRHLHRLTEPRALAGWLITTTRREANRMRHAAVGHVELSSEMAEQTAPVEPSAEHEVLRTGRDRALWSAFRKLSQRCQELLRLTVLAGRAEYGAVAEALHMPHGSIGPTRGRCLNSLRSLYQGEVDS